MAAYLKDDNPINEVPGQIKKYINLRIDLIGLQLSAKLYSGMSVFILSAVVAFAVLFFLFFASYSFIMWYNDYYGNASTGAFIVSGFYLFIALFVFLLRKPLIYNPLKNSVYNKMDFKDFHKESIVGPIENDDDFAREIAKVHDEINDNDKEIDFIMDDAKEYYSFESIKTRFVDEMFANPKPMISTVMQGILAFRSFKSGKKARRK